MTSSSRLEDAIEHYHHLLFDRHLASVQEGVRAVSERCQSYYDGDPTRPLCWVLRPKFVERDEYDGYVRAATLVTRGIVCAAVCPGYVKTRLGGDAALLGVEESISGLRQVIAGLTLERTGSFTRYNGDTIAW